MPLQFAKDAPENTGSRKRFRQLIVVKYHNLEPSTFHLLVRSTAPTNAEDPALAAKDDGHPLNSIHELKDETAEAIDKLRNSLSSYASTDPSNTQIKIALNVHGYSTPLLNFANNAYTISNAKFKADITPSNGGNAHSDYVIFIDFSWPSEHALSLPLLGTLRAMPVALWVVLFLSVCAFLAGGAWLLVAGTLLGLVVTLVLLRLVTYFRDRDRAATYGAYDAVELVRYLHELIADITKKDDSGHTQTEESSQAKVELNLMAHSMGSFVATQMIRTLCDVFNTAALQRWKDEGKLGLGPFKTMDPCASTTALTSINKEKLSEIGSIFKLGRLVLASPDIPIWALSSGRSNPLLASMRRFDEVFIFTNDADMVLRLASTLANFFVFPSGTQEGGYRLGNAVSNRHHSKSRWGPQKSTFNDIGFHGLQSGLGNEVFIQLNKKPFFARLADGAKLRLINCTDYRDTNDVFECMKTPPSPKREETLIAIMNDHKMSASVNSEKLHPRLAAPGRSGRTGRYAATFFQHFIAKTIDSHGGYFQGVFGLDLLYGTLLRGTDLYQDQHNGEATFKEEFVKDLERHQITWIEVEPWVEAESTC